MKVLSLFDGMSCGQIALKRIGVPVESYYASEIDNMCINVTQENFRNTIQLGPIQDVQPIDVSLMLAGSPCQGFSEQGERVNFDDPRSALFFEFARLLKDIQPKWFMLENVKMPQKFQDIISKIVGVEPVEINSADFSAQYRSRLYWTNIPIPPYGTNNLKISDILEPEMRTLNSRRGKYQSVDNIWRRGQPIKCGVATDIKGHDSLKRIFSIKGKSPTLTTERGGNQAKKIAISNDTYRQLVPEEYERLQTVPYKYTVWVPDTYRYRMLGNGWTINVISHILKGMT